MSVQPLVLATRSAGKIRELTALCRDAGFAVDTLDALGVLEHADEAHIEVFETFAENAIAKARYFAARLPGRAILAEDSGLEVVALHGAPGVRSKRWAGSTASGAGLDAANNAALAQALREVVDRRARYTCVAVLVCDGEERCASGVVEGRIVRAPRGAGGFGYDPWFESEELGVTFAEATASEKARVSHRARAIRALFASAGEGLRRRVKSVS